MLQGRRFHRAPIHFVRLTILAALALALAPALAGCGRAAVQAPKSPVPVILAGQTSGLAATAANAGPTPLSRPAPASARTGVGGIPILMYHHLLPYAELRKLPPDSDIVSTERFTAQMAYLARNHYRTLTMADLLQVLNGKQPAPAHAVVLTFDDGYQSNYIYAYPVLKQYHLHGTVFLVTGWVSDTPHPFNPQRLTYLSWPEVKEMAADGTFEFQSHSDGLHVVVDGAPRGLRLKPADLTADLQRSANLIAENTGQRPTALAYPYGVYNAALLKAAAESGIRLGFLATGESAVRPGDPALLLKRYFVAGWRGMALFQRMVDGEQLWRSPQAPAHHAPRSAPTLSRLLLQ